MIKIKKRFEIILLRWNSRHIAYHTISRNIKETNATVCGIVASHSVKHLRAAQEKAIERTNKQNNNKKKKKCGQILKCCCFSCCSSLGIFQISCCAKFALRLTLYSNHMVLGVADAKERKYTERDFVGIAIQIKHFEEKTIY